MMTMPRWGWGALLAVAGLAFWMLMAGSGRWFGIDLGMLGTAMLVTVAWVSMYAVSATPQGALEHSVSPGEWRAWIGLGFMLLATLYFASRIHLFQDGGPADSPHAGAVVRNLVMLMIAWAVLSGVLGARWKGRVQEDERDRQIAARASDWGRGALVFAIVGLAVLFGFSPSERLQWATHFLIGNLLVFVLMLGWLVECAATVAMYRRDRRQARA